MATNVYRSVIDDWLLVSFRTSSVVSLLSLGLLVWVGPSAEWFVAVPVLGLGVVLPWWLLRTTSYTLTERELVIRSGPFHWNVALRQITAIKPTRSALSSPALSLDRLRIEKSDGSAILVSPERRKQFLQDLKDRGVAFDLLKD